MPVVERTVVVAAPPARVWAVICDFASYPRFLPDMEEATVLRAEPDRWTVRFGLRIIRRLDYTLALARESETRLAWSLVEGTFKANAGAWTVLPLDDGAGTRATYRLDLDLGMFVPGSVVKTLLEQTLPATLAAFQARFEAAP